MLDVTMYYHFRQESWEHGSWEQGARDKHFRRPNLLVKSILANKNRALGIKHKEKNMFEILFCGPILFEQKGIKYEAKGIEKKSLSEVKSVSQNCLNDPSALFLPYLQKEERVKTDE